jgi:hypothetical protein
MNFIITGNTRRTSYIILGYVDTSEAIDNFLEDLFWEFAEEELGQEEADKLTQKLRYETQSFEEAFVYLKEWGYGIKYAG